MDFLEIPPEIMDELKIMKDSFMELIIDSPGEFIEMGFEMSPLFNSCKKIWTSMNELKFKAFLKFMYSNSTFKESDRQKMYGYLENPKNCILISEIIDSAINSKSLRCSAILGYYAGKILSEQKPVEYKDHLVINGLRVMFDEDLEIFCGVYEYYLKYPDNYKHNDCSFARISDMMDNFDNPSFTQSDAEISFEKLKGVQLVGYDMGGTNSVGNAWGSFLFNKYSDYFYEIVKESNQLSIPTNLKT
ncbi:hypothetical protein [Methanogenium cariaci]|uniref:hypothetical protein n=1 Tax=Methanogenium cariaci TaxID=2197 RepID=UPI000782D1CA|nr:hypothetical protein [Methanogenium cariaci]